MIILRNIEAETIIKLLSEYKEITCTYIHPYSKDICKGKFNTIFYNYDICNEQSRPQLYLSYLDYEVHYPIPLNCIKSIELPNKYTKPI